MIAGRETGVEELEVVVDLGEGADSRAGGADGVLLLDRDGGRDAIDLVDFRLVHTVEKLPHVGGKCFDVAALAFRIERVKGEGGFAGA